jgi:hypothetical protein
VFREFVRYTSRVSLDHAHLPRLARDTGWKPGDGGPRAQPQKPGGDAGDQRIRCPKCRWVPGRADKWACICGHLWNTFETRGLCPECQYQWVDTACLVCHQWSPHDDWYESPKE